MEEEKDQLTKRVERLKKRVNEESKTQVVLGTSSLACKSDWGM